MKTGAPLVTTARTSPEVSPMPPQSTAKRFWSKVDRSGGPDACWFWHSGLGQDGYGRFTVNGRRALAHRWVYEQEVGPIPDGLVLDHLCRVRNCVRPDHLEPVTNRENILRGTSPPAVHARKMHCVNGHEFTPENTYRRLSGGRSCRQCTNEQQKNCRMRKQERASHD